MEYRRVLWLAPLLLVIHNFEEYLTAPNFFASHWRELPAFISNITAWNSHQFSIALIIVTLLVFLFTYLGSISESNGTGMFWQSLLR